MCRAWSQTSLGLQTMVIRRTFHGVELLPPRAAGGVEGLTEAYFMTSFLSTIPGNRWHCKCSLEGMVTILQTSGQCSLPTLIKYSQLLPSYICRQTDGQTQKMYLSNTSI